MENLAEFVLEEALILIPALFILGKFLKHTPNVPDWTIPWVLLALGVSGAVAMLGANPEAAIQGILATGTAVLTHQLIKQTAEKQ